VARVSCSNFITREKRRAIDSRFHIRNHRQTHCKRAAAAGSAVIAFDHIAGNSEAPRQPDTILACAALDFR
jgi:hypothetical protein